MSPKHRRPRRHDPTKSLNPKPYTGSPKPETPKHLVSTPAKSVKNNSSHRIEIPNGYEPEIPLNILPPDKALNP